MTWARVDDSWWCHPKVLGLDLDARGLWVSALSWSCQQQTPTIPLHIVRMCGDDGTAAKKLVEAGLWDENEDGSWDVHDWNDYQSETAKKRAAGKAGGKKSGESRRAAKQDDEADAGASREAESGASGEAGPSRPDPALPVPTPDKPARKRATQLPDGWEPTDDHRKLAADLKVDPDHEASQFRDHHTAKGSTFKDWDAAFRNWLRNAVKWTSKKPDQASRPQQVSL